MTKTRLTTLLAIILSLVFTITLAVTPTAAHAVDRKNVPSEVNQLLNKINALRAKKKLPKVKINLDASKVALDWSTKMASGGRFDHNPKYATDKRIDQNWWGASENIAYAGSVNGLYDTWVNSRFHYLNMVEKRYNVVGIGIARSRYGTVYGTVAFYAYDGYPKNTYTSYPTPKYKTKGAIGKYYAKHKKVTGAPTSNEKKVSNPSGYYQNFKNGVVYYSSKSGAHLNKGAIRTAYKGAKYEKGLGFPTTDETAFKYKKGAKYQSFQKGIITHSSKTGARVLKGSFQSKWKKLGWERSKLGLPTGNAYKSGSYTKQKFEKGYMSYSKKQGVKVHYTKKK